MNDDSTVLPDVTVSDRSDGDMEPRGRLRRSLERLVDRLLGYDVFISYAWSDGRNYAAALYAALRSYRLSAFLDDERMDAGAPLRVAVGRALRRSSVLVVLTTQGALRSGHVANEVRAFARSDRNIIPIVPENLVRCFRQPPSAEVPNLPDDAIDATPETCEHFTLAILRQRIWLEQASGGSLASPSETVVKKIRNSVGSFRHARLRTAAFGTAAVIFLGLAVFAYVQRGIAETNQRLAVSRQLAAQSSAVAKEQVDRSLLLALAAGEVADTQAADQALLNALANGPPLVAYLRSHAAAVTEILPLRGNDGMLTADMVGIVTRWSAKGKKIKAAKPSSEPIGSLLQITDGTIAVGDYSGLVTLLDPDSLSVIGRIAHPRVARGSANLAWRSSTSELIVGYGGSDTKPGIVVAWTKLTNEKWTARVLLTLNADLMSMALSPDEKTLALGTSDGRVVIWAFNTATDATKVRHVNPPSARQPETFIKSLAFHPSGDRIAFDDGDGGVHIVKLDVFSSGASEICHKHINDVYEIAFLGDVLLSVGSDAKLRLASTASNCTSLVSYQVTAKSLQSLAVLDAAGQVVLTGSGDGSVQLWNLDRIAPIAVATTDDASVPASIAFSPDDRTLVLTGLSTEQRTPDRGFVRAYRAEDLMPLGERLPGLKGPATATLLETNKAPAVLAFDGWLKWPDLASTNYTDTHYIAGNKVIWPGDLYATEAKRVIVAHSHGRIAVRDARSGDKLWSRSLSLPGYDVRSVAISRDGTRIAIGGTNGWIQIIDGATGNDIGEPLKQHSLEVTGLSFGQSSTRLYSGSTDTHLLIWNLDTRSATQIENTVGSIQTIALSVDESMIAASTQRGIIALWSYNGKRFLGTFGTGLVTPITALRFSHAGTKLAAASMAGSGGRGKLAIWDVGAHNWRTRACAIAARSLTPQERGIFEVPSAARPCEP